MLHRLSLRLLTLGVAAAMAVVGPASASTAHAAGDPSGTTDQALAKQALAQAKALFPPSGTSTTFARGAAGSSGSTGPSAVHGGQEATMVLTRLAHHVDDLTSESDRQVARALLARPTAGAVAGSYEHAYRTTEATPLCDAHVCVHYVTSTTDKVPATDADNDGVPDYVQTTLATLDTVWTTEIDQMGYRAPLSDGTRGGGVGKLDVYLQDLATRTTALYGYCAPDTDNLTSPGYCVLENDYSEPYFLNHTPDENLEVTAAHEFFHAVQFGYNSYQDEWLMEGTAAWMEDEVYTDINDNRQYLAASPLSRSWHPLDHGDYATRYDPYFPPYGSWIFWRFLSESFQDPSVIKGVWQRAQNVYSTTALRRELTARGQTFGGMFARFGAWSRDPSRFFSEGHFYRAATLSHSKYTLTRSALSTGNRTTHIDHMAQRYYRFLPGSSLTGDWRVRLSVNMADTNRGSLAQVFVHLRSGGLWIYRIPLNQHGDGHKSVLFTPSKVSSVELDLINDSTRFACNQGSDETCGGYAYDDGRTDVFRATAWR